MVYFFLGLMMSSVGHHMKTGTLLRFGPRLSIEFEL